MTEPTVEFAATGIWNVGPAEAGNRLARTTPAFRYSMKLSTMTGEVTRTEAAATGPGATLLYDDWHPALRSPKISGKQMAMAMLLGIPWSWNGRLRDFTSRFAIPVRTAAFGFPTDGSMAGRSPANIIEQAGLRHFCFHDLRHTFGLLLIQDGASLTYVEEQMDHSSIQITVDTYGHLIPGADIAWFDRLDPQIAPQKSANQVQTAKSD